jgi:hypothetical protein
MSIGENMIGSRKLSKPKLLISILYLLKPILEDEVWNSKEDETRVVADI